MTDEIIIDGIDVSECEYFNPKYEGCHCYNTKEECYAINPNEHKSCKGVNCDYKQLKRKEQECHKYKQALDEIEYQVRELFLGVENKDRPYCGNILDIINKTKET